MIADIKMPDDAKTLKEMLEGAELKNIFDGDRWHLKEVNPQAEVERVSSVARVTLPPKMR